VGGGGPLRPPDQHRDGEKGGSVDDMMDASSAHPVEEPVSGIQGVLPKRQRAAGLAEAQVDVEVQAQGGVLHGVEQDPQAVGGTPGGEYVAVEQVEPGKLHLQRRDVIDIHPRDRAVNEQNKAPVMWMSGEGCSCLLYLPPTPIRLATTGIFGYNALGGGQGTLNPNPVRQSSMECVARSCTL